MDRLQLTLPQCNYKILKKNLTLIGPFLVILCDVFRPSISFSFSLFSSLILIFIIILEIAFRSCILCLLPILRTFVTHF